MNTLEAIKDKLKIKPNVKEYKPVAIVIKTEEKIEKPKPKQKIKKGVQFKEEQDIEEEETEKIQGEQKEKLQEEQIEEEEKGKAPKTTIIDERTKGFDRQTLLKKLAESKILKVTIKPTIENKEEVIPKIPLTAIIEKPKKVKKPIKLQKKADKLIIESDEEEPTEKKALQLQDKPEVEEEERNIELAEEKIEELQEKQKELEEKEEEEEEIIIIKKPKEEKRKTKKAEKGIAILGPETAIQFGDTPIEKRLPKKQPPVIIRVPSYYMNNREIFINFINSLFEPYKREFEQNKENISCDTIGKTNEKLSLLTHQKIVRDYMNLYTPYRGLLLYHGLGSGKTCSSIAIAEGMKDAKKIIVMTPASLRSNYMSELKKCGDSLFKRNQYWEWISVETNPEALPVLSSILNLPQEYIRKNRGAWLVNIKKKTNYADLNSIEKKILDDQLDKMIQSKYQFINYNGLRKERFAEMTSNYTKNIFDNSVIIIDEAHNLISRIVNNLKKTAKTNKPEEEQAKTLSKHIYNFLLSAQNARIVLLTGTPVINYVNEFAILFNILRGYIKTWEFQLDVRTAKKIDKNSLQEILIGEKSLDYLDYSPSSKILTITRNPFGFKNKIKKESGYQGVSNTYKNEKGEVVFETDFTSDEDFEKKIINILKRNDIEIIPNSVKVINKKALPDNLDEFIARYIDTEQMKLKNVDALKRRIIGLSSYFRSAQESLLPKYDNIIGKDYIIERIEMSDLQFKIYETARIEERKLEGKQRKKVNINNKEESQSTYRIFSRLFCNYIIPDRPLPKNYKLSELSKDGELPEIKEKVEEPEEKQKKQESEEPEEQKEQKEKDEKEEKIVKLMEDFNKEAEKMDLSDNNEGEKEADDIFTKIGGKDYEEAVRNTLKFLWNKGNEYLTPEALQTYSPKFLKILENITDEEHKGLHLVYSQFRTLEGIGIFSLVLKKNGFAEFRLKKNSANGSWEIDIKPDDLGKPTFALYTGTEEAEEKEIIRNIYNGDWNDIPTNIADKLRAMSNNNNMGEIIKILMITSSGSEGINLRNTRYVHIMEPYWNPVRLEQVIGRARRICSHKDLPKALQSVEVFVYLMIFSDAQLKSNEAIELKRKDLSKRVPKVPFTSDQYLYEISEIKATFISQLTDLVKETSFDCYIYSNGKCVNFGDPTNTKFSYVPDFAEQQNDITIKANKEKIEWTGKPIKIGNVKYIYRRISNKVLNIYDYSSYEQAMKNPGFMPVQVGTLEKNEKGEDVFKALVT